MKKKMMEEENEEMMAIEDIMGDMDEYDYNSMAPSLKIEIGMPMGKAEEVEVMDEEDEDFESYLKKRK